LPKYHIAQTGTATQLNCTVETSRNQCNISGRMPKIMPKSGQNSSFGPHSRQSALVKLDNRSAEGRHLRRIREKLKAHLGNRPLTFAESEIIERAAWLSLRISMLDSKTLLGHELTEVDSNTYLAWTNSYQKALMRLDPKLVPVPDSGAPAADLAAYLQARAEVAAERQPDAAPLHQDAGQGGSA
jgi:hypothetical protein